MKENSLPEVKKLLSVATEDEKMDFYKQAKGEYAGKPFYYGLAKTAERLWWRWLPGPVMAVSMQWNITHFVY